MHPDNNSQIISTQEENWIAKTTWGFLRYKLSSWWQEGLEMVDGNGIRSHL